MTFTPVKRSDIKFLVSANAFFPDGWTENMFISAFDSGNFYGFIAKDDKILLNVGFITFTVAADTADIGDIFVFSDFRLRGIGGSLLRKAEEYLISAGVKKIFLEVRSSNEAAKNLYISAGFKTFSTRKRYYADGEDALCMAKEI